MQEIGQKNNHINFKRVAIEQDTEFSQVAPIAWVRLIKEVYKLEPLICPRCSGEMWCLSVIEKAPVIEEIPRHMGAWGFKSRTASVAAPKPGGKDP